jgi:hypothetical protein
MQYDSFKGLATLRSLAYPGYTFVYSVRAAAIDWSLSSCFVLSMHERHHTSTEVLWVLLSHRPK